MTCRYELVAVGRCPADFTVLDRYEVTIECADMVQVEVLHAVVADLTADPIFQETLTQALAERTGAKVTTVGWHSGVKTTCICS